VDCYLILINGGLRRALVTAFAICLASVRVLAGPPLQFAPPIYSAPAVGGLTAVAQERQFGAPRRRKCALRLGLGVAVPRGLRASSARCALSTIFVRY